jgi:flagellar biosynthesis protein FlhF
MRVKKYRGKTIKDATAKVKHELGDNAMIISTNRLTESGGKKWIEINAVPADSDILDENRDPLGQVKSELMGLKEMICLLNQTGGVAERLVMNPGLLNLYSKLITNGVNDHHARLFMERAGAFNGQAVQAKNVKQKTVSEIAKVIKTKDPFATEDRKQMIAAFIGTTGVGKTTTVAKLAAQLMLKSKKKVGLISIDSYRIGAMEQLSTYANILGVPCFKAFKKKDLIFALKRMEEKDVVLIDTAGQSQYDTERIEELKKMIPNDLAIDTHLLLSVATTESEMNETADNFSDLKFQSYVFTKVDEAKTFGSAINQIMKLKLPVSYITTGQNVPEDIQRADKVKMLNLLFKSSYKGA